LTCRASFHRICKGSEAHERILSTGLTPEKNEEDDMHDLAMLEGKKVLLVDDEPDILDMLSEELEMCELYRARDFESAKQIMEKERFDCVVLDIMGVQGYELLQIATSFKIPAVMLTAHALSPENFIRSIRSGAHCYVPKDKIIDICFFVWDAIRAHKQQEKEPSQWFEKRKSFFKKKFGRNWTEAHDPNRKPEKPPGS